MNRKLIAFAPLLIAFSAFSQSTLSLQKEISAQVINSQPAAVSLNNEIQVKAGSNQLALTIGQIVFEDGKRRKFDSELLVMAFDAPKNESLSLNYKTFRTIEEAKAFSAKPSLQLTNANGESVDYELVQLRKNGLQGFRDYEREVADYNAKNGVTTEATINVRHVPVEMNLKQSFSEMSRQEQQAFMQWAMQNLK
ncbi:YccT family protein [Vibrio sp. M260118]|uniref:YccT family protein n=1 Tax=Vibrio sp. M260118 TaxID=3020896 RepID=UPI002F42AB9B